MYRCNLCKDFEAPADFIGASLVRGHLREAHNIYAAFELQDEEREC